MTSHVLANMNETITNDYSVSHQAVDVVSGENQIDDVIAISDGTVEMVVKDVQYTNHNTKGTDTYGNFVKIRHDNGQKSLYAHLQYESVTVSDGQNVSKGEKIGKMGDTGNAYGAHLHFEVRNPDETRENPNEYLNGQKTLENEATDEANSNETSELNEDNVAANIQQENSNNENIPKQDTTIITPIVKTSSPAKNETIVLKNNNYLGGSIVDALKEIGFDSSYDNRSIIALKNGIDDYHGTYDENIYLLQLLKEGKLNA